MRTTLPSASRTRRARKRSRSGAVMAPSSTIQRNSPLLVTAEISPRLARLWLTRTSGVWPGGAQRRPRTSSERRPVSSPRRGRTFGLGADGNGRVIPPQPASHRRRILLGGPSQRLLRGEPPAPQVSAHGADRQPHLEALPDQLAHRRPAPECKRQAQLVRRVALDQPARLGL